MLSYLRYPKTPGKENVSSALHDCFMSKRYAIRPAGSLILGPRFLGRAFHPARAKGAACNE